NGDDHAKALENYTAKQLLKRRNTGFVQGLFRAALLEIESPRSMSTRDDNIRRVLPSTANRPLFTVLRQANELAKKQFIEDLRLASVPLLDAAAALNDTKYEGANFNNRDKRDMFGSDFVADLLMTNCLTGSSVCCSGSVASYLAKRAAEFRIELYPSLLKAGGFDSIRPGGSYLGVPRRCSGLECWRDSVYVRFRRACRSEAAPLVKRDIERDVTEFAAALHRSFVQQVESYSASAPSIVNDAAVMDAGQILCLLASSDASAEVEALARCRWFPQRASLRTQRQFNAHSSAAMAGRGWTTPCITGRIVKVELEPAEREGEFATCLRVTTESSDEAVSVRLNEDFIYKSLYFDAESVQLGRGTDGRLSAVGLCAARWRHSRLCLQDQLDAAFAREAGARLSPIASTPPEQEKKEDEAALKLAHKTRFHVAIQCRQRSRSAA
uniref:RNB domain-containing protein n=1 Tax=Macrostomum lignano TaxID=282301 RepID=A0A1I8F796_9PLAT